MGGVVNKSSESAARTSATTRFPQRGFISGDVPAGKWKHDKYFETYGGNRKRRNSGVLGRGVSGVNSAGGKSIGGIAARLASKASRTKQSGMVKMQISNLPSTVVTSDLEELFQDYNVYGIVVHYDETGTHLGTGDLFTDEQTASEIVREFKGIAIDEQEIKFCIVAESGAISSGIGAKVNILDRLHRVAGNPIKRRSLQLKKRTSGGGIRKKVGSARAGPAARKLASSPTKDASSSSAAAKARMNKTAKELDMELDAYMQKK